MSILIESLAADYSSILLSNVILKVLNMLWFLVVPCSMFLFWRNKRQCSNVLLHFPQCNYVVSFICLFLPGKCSCLCDFTHHLLHRFYVKVKNKSPDYKWKCKLELWGSPNVTESSEVWWLVKSLLVTDDLRSWPFSSGRGQQQEAVIARHTHTHTHTETSNC